MTTKYVPPHKRNATLSPTEPEQHQAATAETPADQPSTGSGWTPKTSSFSASNSSAFRSSSGPYGGVSQREESEVKAMFTTSINSGINFDKYDEIPVSTRGNSPPTPIESFYAEGVFHPSLVKIFKLASYERPTPIQKWAFAVVKAKRDLMACAQTGSGKTGAFLIPIVSGILTAISLGAAVPSAARQQQQPQFGASHQFPGMPRRSMAKPLSLILAPTRELVQQIHTEARKFTYQTGLASCAVFGGEDPMHQLRSLERGCDILVATPGRLTDMIERGRVALDAVQYLVLDEADRMLDMGFEPQIRKIIEQSGMPIAGQRQTLMFSATFPKEIQDMARCFLHDYVYVAVGKVGASSENIAQHIERVNPGDKHSLLLDILSNSAADPGLTLIFTETKRAADELENYLYQNNLPVVAIHGDKSQQERTRAINTFRSGRAKILVATSVASRGLDIPNVNHVINYELPGDMDDYVHRIGRTGRAGNLGKATTFFTDANRGSAKDLVRILEDAKQVVPPWLRALSSGSFGMGSGPSGAGGGRGGYRKPASSQYGGSGGSSQWRSGGGGGSSW